MNFPESSGIGEELLCLLDEHGLTQYVSEPTRENNILDIIATCEEDSVVGLPVKVTNLGVPFDHNLVSCQLHVGLEIQSRAAHTYRDYKSIDVSKFRQMLSTSSLFSAPEASASAYANQIESVTTTIINELAPLKTSFINKRRKPHVWLSDEATAAKRRKRRLE